MEHVTTMKAIENNINNSCLCLYYIKAPDCGVCNVMLDKVGGLADKFPMLSSFYTDISEEPLISGRFWVYSGPTVLLLCFGKEVYRASQFINLEELERQITRYIQMLDLCDRHLP